MPGLPEYLLVLTTTDSLEEAEKIGAELVRRSLAACVSITPNACSIYEWEGKIHKDREFQLLIKTKAPLYKAVEACIKTLHTYKLPEIVALPVSKGSLEYLHWIDGKTT
jgi:periplasmic divalent cation tolerance protein